MHRFGLLVSILVVVLVDLGAHGSTSTAVAEATPAAMAAPLPLAPRHPDRLTPALSMATPTAEPVCVGVIEGDFYVRPQHTTFRAGEPYVGPGCGRVRGWQ